MTYAKDMTKVGLTDLALAILAEVAFPIRIIQIKHEARAGARGCHDLAELICVAQGLHHGGAEHVA